MRPITNIPDHFGDVDDLRRKNDELEAANDELARQLNAADANDNRAAEVAGIGELADTSGFDVVPAQVIAIGAAQSFSRTVTIDKGSSDGISADLTVINADGLVGRVIEVTPSHRDGAADHRRQVDDRWPAGRVDGARIPRR